MQAVSKIVQHIFVHVCIYCVVLAHNLFFCLENKLLQLYYVLMCT